MSLSITWCLIDERSAGADIVELTDDDDRPSKFHA